MNQIVDTAWSPATGSYGQQTYFRYLNGWALDVEEEGPPVMGGPGYWSWRAQNMASTDEIQTIPQGAGMRLEDAKAAAEAAAKGS